MNKIILLIFTFILAVSCSAKEISMKSQHPQSLSRGGQGESYEGSANFFTGKVKVQPVYPEIAPSRASGAYVIFEAGARSNWHNHPAGQTLIVTEGVAWTQEDNGATFEAHPGEVIHCPPNIKHWHGASAYGPMTHFSIVEGIDGVGVTWMEPVTDKQYDAAKQSINSSNTAKHSLGDKRQSIVTISAFTASGDIGRLKASINEGLDAGLTVNEIKEVIVQLYAYAGFPRSLNALGAFMQVLGERGNKDKLGEEGKALAADIKKLEYGTKVQTELVGMPVSGSLYDFAPAIDQFLKEHLFADIFGRGVLSHQDRELATMGALSNITGAENQLKSHMNLALNTGLTKEQIKDVVSIIDAKVGKTQGQKAKEVFSSIN